MPEGGQVTMAMARGLDVLRAFDTDEEWIGNQELAARTGLPRATISRATNTLVQSGFLEADPATQKFRLGPAVLVLAGRVTGLPRLRAVLRPIMRQLSDETGASIGAVHLEHTDAVFFEYCRASGPVALALSAGGRAPLIGSASGAAILALATPAERAHVLRNFGADEAVRLRQAIGVAGSEIERDGYCRAFGSWHAEVNVIAAAWRLPVTGMLIAITAAGPTWSMPADRVETRVAPRLLAAMDRMRRQFEPSDNPDGRRTKTC